MAHVGGNEPRTSFSEGSVHPFDRARERQVALQAFARNSMGGGREGSNLAQPPRCRQQAQRGEEHAQAGGSAKVLARKKGGNR